MRNIRFWIPVIIGALVTPIFLYLIYASASSGTSSHAGAGMGAILLFYPLPMFFMVLSDGGPSADAFLTQVLSRLGFIAILLQLPVYGFVISYANLKKSWWLRLARTVVWLHLIAIFAGLVVFFIQSAL